MHSHPSSPPLPLFPRILKGVLVGNGICRGSQDHLSRRREGGRETGWLCNLEIALQLDAAGVSIVILAMVVVVEVEAGSLSGLLPH